MTKREETELLLVAKTRELYRLYKNYNPNGDRLHIIATGDYVSIWNRYWDDDEGDKKRPIDVWDNGEQIISRNHDRVSQDE